MGVLREMDPALIDYPDSPFNYPSSGTSSTMDEEFDEVCKSDINSKFDFLLLEKSVFVVRKRQKS